MSKATTRTDQIMALAEGYAIGMSAIEFPDYRKERLAALRAEVQNLEDDLTATREDRDKRRTDNEAMEAIVWGRYCNKDANAILTEARDIYVCIKERAEKAEAECEILRKRITELEAKNG